MRWPRVLLVNPAFTVLPLHFLQVGLANYLEPPAVKVSDVPREQKAIVSQDSFAFGSIAG